ncbi:Mcp1p Ecym_8334 [Eremothecium cymbalariae DBVPG|uniref:Uncharacterized protein n=1 Tax=Eremothecium cymbalariae (strain CBS 270.75 / DBVPG 7215 / KCTC 17166 / NRRL Y-17582) TaxID=931890 RepID=G8JXN8_ERECY|nr:Hypothetical protein Ecym_8334 [Eremothecium cymbalariae DBVPG\
MRIRSLDPRPTDVSPPPSSEAGDEGWLPSCISLPRIRKSLIWLKRHSLWAVLFGYFPLYVSNTLTIVFIEPKYTTGALATVREHLPSLVDILLTWTIGIYVVSGLTLAVINWVRWRQRQERKYITRAEDVDTSPQKISDVGLVGLLSSYLVKLNRSVKHSLESLSKPFSGSGLGPIGYAVICYDFVYLCWLLKVRMANCM